MVFRPGQIGARPVEVIELSRNSIMKLISKFLLVLENEVRGSMAIGLAKAKIGSMKVNKKESTFILSVSCLVPVRLFLIVLCV